MALTVPTFSANRMLGYILNASQPEDLLLKLFENDVTPASGDTEASYIEPWQYSPRILTGIDWSIDDARAAASAQSFEFQDYRGKVFGYFIVTANSGKLMWAERFSDGPYRIQNKGDKITVAARLTLM